jgi:2-keto-3-deoxy-L-rhamnonate aldolase RhmA
MLRKLSDTDRDVQFGTVVMEFSSPGIGHILKNAGCDFAFVDMEHSGFGFETIKAIVQFMNAAQLPVFVRPRSKSYQDITLACDMGPQGLFVTHVGSADEARTILNCMAYPPIGSRGAVFRAAHDQYTYGPMQEKVDAANEAVSFYAIIEDRNGLANVEEVLAVEGVAGIAIGHTDLSVDLGIPGDLDNDVFREAEARIARACRDSGKIYVRAVATVDDALAQREAGADALLYSGDVWLLQDALRDALAAIRASSA